MTTARPTRTELFRNSILATSVASIAMCSVSLGAVTDEDDNVVAATGAVSVRIQADDNSWVDTDKINYLYDVEGTSISVVVNNGEVAVHRDGEAIPLDRIENEDGQIFILDDDGTRVNVMSLPGKGNLNLKSHNLFPGENAQTIFLERTNLPILKLQNAEPPAVMLGIWMDEPGEALRRHLDLKPQTTAIINGIYDGLPAEKAGVEQYDIIVKIDGHAPATPDAVREVLNSKDADDEIKLTVINRGKKKDLVVVLEPYDAERMQAAKMIGRANVPMGVPHTKFFAPGDGKNSFEFFFDGKENGFPGNMQWNVDVEKYLDENMKRHLEESLQGAIKVMPELDGEVLDQYFERLHNAAERDGVDEEERVERLNKRLEELERLLERLTTELGERPE